MLLLTIVPVIIRTYAAHNWPRDCLALAGRFPDFPLRDENTPPGRPGAIPSAHFDIAVRCPRTFSGARTLLGELARVTPVSASPRLLVLAGCGPNRTGEKKPDPLGAGLNPPFGGGWRRHRKIGWPINDLKFT